MLISYFKHLSCSLRKTRRLFNILVGSNPGRRVGIAINICREVRSSK